MSETNLRDLIDKELELTPEITLNLIYDPMIKPGDLEATAKEVTEVQNIVDGILTEEEQHYARKSVV